jgi:hypothetical protein
MVLIGPNRRLVVIEVPRRIVSGSAAAPPMRPPAPPAGVVKPELVQAPVPKAPAEPPSPEGRAWRTPGRARLAEVVRADR